MSKSTTPQSKVVDALEMVAEYGLPPVGAARLLDVGNTGYLEYFDREVLEQLVSRGGSTCRFFEGAYGSGKTHLLTLIGELALDKGLVFAHTDLSHAVSLEDWGAVTAYILGNMQAKIDHRVVKSLPEILLALGRTGLVDPVNLERARLPHPGFRRAILTALDRCNDNLQSWGILRRYLLGERVYISELRAQGLQGIKSPLSKRNAELVLKTVLGALFHLGFSGTVLLFDENERTLVSTRAPSKGIKNSANLMRRLIDGGVNNLLVGTVVVFAVLPGFLERCNEIYPALGQRLQLLRGGANPAWRWPVMPIDMINTASLPDDFLKGAADLFSDLVDSCGGKTDGLMQIMLSSGTAVVEGNAGAGYKRELMKLLAALALKRLEVS